MKGTETFIFLPVLIQMSWGGVTLAILALLSTSIARAAGQRLGERFEKKSFEELREELAKDPSAPHVINALRIKGDKRAVPILKEALKKVPEGMAQEEIGVALVRLGDKENGWPVLEMRGKAALDSDMPYPIKTDPKGELVGRTPSPEFLAWCKKTGRKPEEAADWALHSAATTINALARSADPRAVPLLLKGLRSNNHSVALSAAHALAYLRHKPAAKAIIDEARKRPPSMAVGMGMALACFDDPAAQAAVSEFIKDEKAVAELKKKAQAGKCSLLVGP